MCVSIQIVAVVLSTVQTFSFKVNELLKFFIILFLTQT